jgi:hypothetical protein
VRDALKTHQVCTIVLLTADGSCLRIRKAATAEPDVQDIYRRLAISPQIIKPQHSWTAGCAILDRLLKRLLGRKDELLRVLERPEIPLNTNASENDIRALSRSARSPAEPSAKRAAKPQRSCSASPRLA